MTHFGFKYDLRYITEHLGSKDIGSYVILIQIRVNVWSKSHKIGYCIQYFCYLRPNLVPVRLKMTPVASNMILGTLQSTQKVKTMGLG